MPQIAQQDHLRIEIANIDDLTVAEKSKLKECIAAGTILDVVLFGEWDGEEVEASIVGLNKSVQAIDIVYSGGVKTLSLQ